MPKNLIGSLELEDPFDLVATLESGQVFRWRRVDSKWYAGIVGRYPLLLRQEPGKLVYRCDFGIANEIEEALFAFFRLDDSLLDVYESVNGDAKLSDVIKRNLGLRLIRQEPWECLISFVCSSVSNIPRISRNMEAIAKKTVSPKLVDTHSIYPFPTVAQLANCREEELRELGLGFRAKYVTRISWLIANEQFDLFGLKSASYNDAKTALMSLPGVGAKVADCILVFSFDKLQGFPVDRWVRRSIKERYFENTYVTDTDIVSWAQERWGSYAGYIQQYLFQDQRLINARR
jgi:N-glycosylase/DNA lyase